LRKTSRDGIGTISLVILNSRQLLVQLRETGSAGPLQVYFLLNAKTAAAIEITIAAAMPPSTSKLLVED